ncbi:MAG: peptidase [Acaryochloris sp. SU_5_25]|nr:peptidase [Acaryochloris sp. SU_5_25]
MTYCLGIITRYGLVMAADSRTNAGVDYVSTAQKLFDLSQPGERVLLVCTAGNLSMTQSVLTLMQRDRKAEVTGNLNELTTMYDIANYFGEKTRQVLDKHQKWLKKDNISVNCSFLIGGQLRGEVPEMYMVYSQGNILRTTRETPYLQIGEIKYGKPILDRTIHYEDTSLDVAAKCALLSLDSTMKSNISVGPPITMAMYKTDTFEVGYRLKLERGDPYLLRLRKSWETSLRQAFKKLPDLSWDNSEDLDPENYLVMTDILP